MKLEGIERSILRKEEKEKIQKKIGEIFYCFNNINKEMNAAGIPVDSKLRISSEEFIDVYSEEEIQLDKLKVSGLQKKFNLQEDYNIEDVNFSGELLEVAKTFLFNKHLKDRFISVRSSFYDDYINHVDNVIIDKKSGKIICAIDETSDMRGNVFKQKLERILSINKNGGVKLKYGIFLKNGQIIKGPVYDVPYLYLSLEKKYVLNLIKNIDLKSTNKFESNILLFFLQLINQQISALRLENILNKWEFLEEIEDFILKYVSDFKKRFF